LSSSNVLQVFRMAILVPGPLWNSTGDNSAPKPFLLFSVGDTYRPGLSTVKAFYRRPQTAASSHAQINSLQHSVFSL